MDAGWEWQADSEARRWFEEHNGRTNVPKVSEMIQSKFLRKEDFDEDQVCTIRTVKLEDVTQSEQRWVLYFQEHQKGMVLNTTTIRVLEQAYGDDSDRWSGKRVKVYVDPNVSFQGRIVGGLRLRTPKHGSVPPPPQPTNTTGEQFDDDIPF